MGHTLSPSSSYGKNKCPSVSQSAEALLLLLSKLAAIHSRRGDLFRFHIGSKRSSFRLCIFGRIFNLPLLVQMRARAPAALESVGYGSPLTESPFLCAKERSGAELLMKIATLIARPLSRSSRVSTVDVEWR